MHGFSVLRGIRVCRRFALIFWTKQPFPNAMAVAGCPRGPIFLLAKPAQRGTTALKPVAKGRRPVIPYPRWPNNDF
jgi:hypothetical protein